MIFYLSIHYLIRGLIYILSPRYKCVETNSKFGQIQPKEFEVAKSYKNRQTVA